MIDSTFGMIYIYIQVAYSQIANKKLVGKINLKFSLLPIQKTIQFLWMILNIFKKYMRVFRQIGQTNTI